MKLFFDENLSERLPQQLASIYPDSTHPRLCGMAGASDHAIMKFAVENGFIIVTRDVDLPKMVRFSKRPAKVIWLEFHNPATRVIANALRTNIEQIEAFSLDATKFILIIRQIGSG